MTTPDELQKIVWDNLTAALDGEQEFGTPEDEANQLICYAEDCENFTTEDVLPHVKSWYLKHGLLTRPY